MPVYKHESFIDPNPKMTIWRYMDFDKFKSLLETECLFFCRADKFSDPFEGSLPKKEAKGRLNSERLYAANFFREFNEEQALKNISGLSYWHKKLKTVTTVNYWNINNSESVAMWGLYLKNNEGVAIQSTTDLTKEIIDKVPENIGISKVRYLDYDKDIWYHPIEYPIRNYNTYIPLIHKRIEFIHESELRLIHEVMEVFEDDNYWEAQPNHFGKFVKVDIRKLIQNIYLPPTIDDIATKKITDLIESFGYNFPIVKSKLSDIPNY